MCAVIRRLTIPLLLVVSLAVAAGCNGSSSDSPSSTVASSVEKVKTAQTLPAEGTAKLPDGRIYTVVSPGQALKLDDVTLLLDRITWSTVSSSDAKAPPGARYIASADVTIGNRTTDPQTVGPTQIWLLAGASTFVANPGGIVGKQVQPGKTRQGKVGFYLPRKQVGGLLLYRFADAAAIAKAKHVGVARYGKS